MRQEQLRAHPRRWLVTGVAGFIGSHLLQQLLTLGQEVIGLDSFVTGHQHNLDDVAQTVGPEVWSRFQFIEGDITDQATCGRTCRDVELVLHQAALGSVPRSIENPLASHESNITGFLNMLIAARDAGVARFVYASSSAVYGDHPALPKHEEQTGNLLSPYALTKMANELYASVFARCYGMQPVGLRYFNVFGRRQDPNGAYAAVIPRWFRSLLNGESCRIFGDGETSRDFTHVSNVVQANLLAATTDSDIAGRAFNVACGGRMTLRELHDSIGAVLVKRGVLSTVPAPTWQPFRPGDVRHSLADISKAGEFLGYEPGLSLSAGLDEAAEWYIAQSANGQRMGAV
ncbi:MAG: SDR family oxidoreductase [Candidatus Saccharimonas sp.]|nr:SDR family oxidoreductase [Planctomycetaceae bacterium]